jgi:dipeptidyl aminopeptidase/acylaminoacyl peptidase
MENETGLTPEAIKERYSILFMEKLNCPVLILHGEKDIMVSQALLLRDLPCALRSHPPYRLAG